MEIILTIGPSSCGKTTWATEEVKKSKGKIVNINRDDIRRSLFVFDSWKDYKFTAQKESLVTETQVAMTRSAISKGLSVIISDTNLNPVYRQNWEELAKELKVKIVYKTFEVELNELRRRNIGREASIDPTILKQQYLNFMSQFGGLRVYQADPTKPKAVIFDLDGTLAIMNDRSPYDWSRVGEDSVNENVADLFRMIRMMHPDWSILTVSGRDGVCTQQTLDWLNQNDLRPDGHFQRKQDDSRKDSIVKQEIFWEHIAENFNIMYAVDDRQQVVEMWDMIGVEVWQVQQSEF